MGMEAGERAHSVCEEMLEQDAFSRWLKLRPLDVEPGRVVLEMKVREEMLNGFGICHGGILFSLADTAFAVASNSRGRVCLALDTNITYVSKVTCGETLTAEAEEIALSGRIAVHRVLVQNNKNEVVAAFRGTTYRTDESFHDSQEVRS